MKKAAAVLLVIIFFGTVTCKKSTTSYTPDCTGTTPKFTADVSPLIQSSCAISGCHASGNNNGAGPLTTYTQIKNAGTDIRSSVVSGSMPQNSSLTNAQRNIIVCWIEAGAQNN